MAKINMAKVRVAVARDAGPQMKEAAHERAEQVFTEAVIQMQQEFEDHPISVELANGIFAPNYSATLGGSEDANQSRSGGTKSLYGFIGFKRGTDPLAPIREALDPTSTAGKEFGAKLVYRREEKRGDDLRFVFEIHAPNKREIYKLTPIPWATGWSWAQKVETSIPGFARFLAKHMPKASDKVSRSKGGTQLKVDLPGRPDFSPQLYLTFIFGSFLSRVKSYQTRGLRRVFR